MGLLVISIAALFGCFSSLAQGCEQNTVEYTWDKGQNSTLRIEAPANVFKWKVAIEYDSAPIRLNPNQGRTKRCEKEAKTCEIASIKGNHNLNAGDILEIGYEIAFKKNSVVPTIVGMKFIYCDAKPCPKWNDPEATFQELTLCPEEPGCDDTQYCAIVDCSKELAKALCPAQCAAPPFPTTEAPATEAPPSGETCGIKPDQVDSQIIGGEEAGPYSLPWQVALVFPEGTWYGDTPFCGGTLISDRHILTAAHCTDVNGGVWEIMVGEHDASDSSDGTRHTVCRVMNHPSYGNFNNDFAVVTLSQPVTIGSRANYACLPTSDMGGSFLDDKTMTVSGWGSRTDGSSASAPDKLYTVDLPGVSEEDCTGFSLTEQMLCAGRPGENKVGACNGDSGGPLTYNNGGRATLVGAVSYGAQGCWSYTVFARVTSVLPWIQDEMEQQCQ